MTRVVHVESEATGKLSSKAHARVILRTLRLEKANPNNEELS